MSRNVLIAIYVVIGLLALYITVQRVLAGAWMGVLLSGIITLFCVYRLYTLLAPSSDSAGST